MFHKYVYEYIDLLYLTFIALIVGSYISFVNPGYYTLKTSENETIVFNKFKKIIIVDLSIHLFFFGFVVYYYYFYYKELHDNIPFITALLIVLIYVVSIDVSKVYNISFQELGFITIASTFLYFFL